MARLKEVKEALDSFLNLAAQKAREDAKGGKVDISDILSLKPEDDEIEMIDEAYVEELRQVVQEQMRTKEGARRLFVAIGFAIRQVARFA